MFIKKISFLLFLLTPFFIFAGGQVEAGDGLTFNIDNFDSIEGSAAFDIEVRQSDRFSVVVYASQSDVSKLQVKKSGRTLELGMKPFTFGGWKETPRAVISMPKLRSVDLSGATDMIAAGFRSDSRFSSDLSGASSLEIDITAPSVNIELSGSSSFKAVIETKDLILDLSGGSEAELVGRGETLKADFSGSSSGDLKDFPLSKATVELSGSSDLFLTLNGRLDLDASGSFFSLLFRRC